MNDSGAKPGRRKWGKRLLIVALAVLAGLSGLAWYATTDSFQSMVRRRLVAELQRITGGRIELGSIHTIPFRFVVDVRDLTVHGREAAGEVPYAHVDRLVAKVNLASALGAGFGFDSLVLERPIAHIIFYPDGTTNQPQPQVRVGSGAMAKLFSVSIGHLEVRHGSVLWNHQDFALDVAADDVSADLNYSLLHLRYDGSLLIGKINTRFDGYRPVAWMMETHFTQGLDSLDLQSLKATSGRSHLEAKARLSSFSSPEITGEYDLTLDLGEVGAVSRHPEMHSGMFHATGNGSWSAAQFAAAGKLLVKDLDWRAESLKLHADSVSTQYSLDPQRLGLSGITAKVLGGEVSGDAEVTNWLRPAVTSKDRKPQVVGQKGSIRLRMKGLSAQEIVTSLSSADRPFQGMNLAGVGGGTVETRWRGSPRSAETELTLEVAPPAQVAAEQLPINARGRAVYRTATAELEVSEFNANTRSSQVRASGTLSTRAAMKLSVSTSDLGEWERVLVSAGYRQHTPVDMRGRASFTGSASGRLSEVDFEGKLQSQDFEVLIPASAGAPRKQIRWDYLAAEVELSPRTFAAHNGTLRHGETSVGFDLEAELDGRRFVDSSAFTASVQMHDAQLAEILAIVGHDYPASGKMDLFVHASGTRAQPHADGTIHLTDAVVQGQAIQRFDSKFSLNPEQLSLEGIQLAHYQAQVSGEGTYDFPTRGLRFHLYGTNFDLAHFASLQRTRVAVEGSMDFEAQSSGTLDQPVINAKIRLRDLTLDHDRMGDYRFDAVTHGRELRLTGLSEFKDSQLDIDGTVNLRGDWPSNVNLHFRHLDVDPLLRNYLRRRVTGHSTAAGDLQLSGPWRTPRELQVTGNISDFFAELEHIQVRNNGPIRFAISNQVLDIQQLRLASQGTDLTVGGTIQLRGERQINLRAAGNADLQLIQSFDSDFTSKGTVAVDLTLAGTIVRPAIQGRLQVSNGSIQYSDLPSALSDINGSLVFNTNRLQIETLTTHVGGGVVSFGGYATAYNGQLGFDLTLKGQDVRLRYPPGISSVTTDELRWSGTSAASTLSGDMTVTKLGVTPGFDFASYLRRSAQGSVLPQTNPLLGRIRMDVHIVTTPELEMQTAVARLSGDADLRLRGTAAKPVLMGRADVIEGEIYFSGTKYRMERGDVTFASPVTTTAVLDLQASTRVQDYDITVNLNGGTDKLNLSYHSEPPLPTADIISLLALGQTQEQSAQMQQYSQSPFSTQVSNVVLGEALNSAISNRSQRLFGISHIKINPQGINTETTPTQSNPYPAVTIEQQVRDNLTLAYTTNVNETSQQIIQGEYNINKSLSIVGLRDYNGVVSFEVRFRQRRK
ncbi:MAG: translocation/assembly module TamB domain-containing protein [Terriglobales bacterium]